MKKPDSLSVTAVLALAALGVFVWWQIIFTRPATRPEINFLDVGQGDSELLMLPGGIRILTDAGPNQKILQSLESAFKAGDNYIDLAIISHPQLDHFNGFNYVLDHYRVGAFIFNGRSDTEAAGGWPQFVEKIKSQKIPLITVSQGDKIKYGDSEIDFLSPGPEYAQSAELNDVGLVELIRTGGWRALLTADIGANIEDYLVKNWAALRVDILKIPHHGSKYSSSAEFLNSVRPRVAVIEVGESNKYGHPTKEVLERLASAAAKIFRTDQNGNIEIFAENGKLKVFTEK